MVQVFYFYLRADWYQYRVSHFTDGKTEYSEVVAFRAGTSASDSIQRMVSHSSNRHHLPVSRHTCPVHLWFLVTPEGELRAKELTTCLPFNQYNVASVSFTLNFCSFCLFFLEPLAVFFQPVSSCSFLAISLAPGDFVHSFVIPGAGAIQQNYGSDQCWAPW